MAMKPCKHYNVRYSGFFCQSLTDDCEMPAYWWFCNDCKKSIIGADDKNFKFSCDQVCIHGTEPRYLCNRGCWD